MKNLGTVRLETDRLILRRFTLSDAEPMFRNWANDTEVTKYLMWPPHEDAGVSLDVLTDWTAQYADDAFYQWAIVLKDDGPEPVGCISVVRMDESIGMVHIGYCIGKKWWRRGITSEALGGLIRFFFEDVGANRIESRHDPRNPNSGRVMQKCGLLYEGTMKQGDWNNQGICDCSLYGLTAEDYFRT